MRGGGTCHRDAWIIGRIFKFRNVGFDKVGKIRVPQKKVHEKNIFKSRTNKKLNPLLRQSAKYEPEQLVVLGYTMSTQTPIK